jgi:phage-related tail protein
MKNLVATLGLAVVLTLAGCGGSDNSAGDVGQAYVTALDRVAGALESVKDEDSAKAAAREIAAANDSLESMADEINSMSKTEQVMMLQKHAAKMAEVEARISQAMQKIVSDDPKLLDIIGGEIQNMPKIQ